MANVIIKSDERREHERYVRHSFCANDPATREAADVVAAKSREALEYGRHLESRRVFGMKGGC